MSDRFQYEPDDLTPSQCILCRRMTDVGFCEAFPGGIPASIRVNVHDHRKPWIDPATGNPGERVDASGPMLFAPREDAEPEAVALLADYFAAPTPPPPVRRDP